MVYVTLPVLSHYFWGNTDNLLESADPGHMARGDKRLTMVLADALIQRNQWMLRLTQSECCHIVKHWNCPEAVLQCRPALMKCAYIICPFVSTSYLVAVQESPQVHKFLQWQKLWPFDVLHPIWLPEATFKTDLSTEVTEPKLPALTGTCLCLVLGDSVWFGGPGFLLAGQEATCADGS